MENQSSFFGISSSAWRVICILGLTAGAILICALVLLAFFRDSGIGFS